jgi:acetyl esterase/lipase
MNDYQRRRWLVCAAVIAVASATVAVTTEPQTSQIWPGAAPGAKGQAEGDIPTLTTYLPDNSAATGMAVVVCPGGGYGALAMDHEGRQVAQWLNSLGSAAFVLKYRHGRSGAGYGHPAPLQDVQRAVRTVRSKADQWRIDPDRIGIIGFSAGGHLASTAATHFNDKVYEPVDDTDKADARPDFAILVYPVITMTDPHTHKGSQRNLLGDNPDRALIERLSNEKQVTPQTPPTFLVHTQEDTVVPAENSINFYLALRAANVPAEMHLYQKGPHGFGLGHPGLAASDWPARCAEWLRSNDLLGDN